MRLPAVIPELRKACPPAGRGQLASLPGVLAVTALLLLPSARGGESTAAPLAPSVEPFAFEPLRNASFRLEGVLGERVRANVDHWLIPAPRANPGMIQMFRSRDRRPAPNLVPWAGEFAGKYLISAIQALRLTDRRDLRDTVRQVIAELLSTQAEDGYLGPFPKATRLRGNWDLWGHYHCMLALLMWHEMTGDQPALSACRRAADLVCDTYLDTGIRVFDAGSQEMNMAVIHSLGWLYRLTRQPRYLRLMREIERDWEKAGDYLRAGLDGREFYQTPRPRWESLHDLQGLLELYRITGEAKYRNAFEHHWRSIRQWDRRNTGGFSSGEQATGNPYAPTAIETCCTVAWMALSVDMLRLTGDPRVVDELELATYNAAAGAQHPSGRWWTYNTPMDGAREASAHAIVFQARAGTPELNCCSVNGPRSLGMLSEWAVMTTSKGLALNHYGPGSFAGTLPNGAPVKLRVEGDYPRAGQVKVRVEAARAARFELRLRIPAWSGQTRAELNGASLTGLQPGAYYTIERCKGGDVVTLDLDMSLRSVAGAKEAAEKVSLYRGPLLLAWDQRWNEFDEEAVPPLDLTRLREASVVEGGALVSRAPGTAGHEFRPWLILEAPTPSGKVVRLCDFASAGASGTRYRSWLPATSGK